MTTEKALKLTAKPTVSGFVQLELLYYNGCECLVIISNMIEQPSFQNVVQFIHDILIGVEALFILTGTHDQ
jgi:hypothetical protein